MVSGMVMVLLALAQSTPDQMPANTWLEVPNTKMRALDPCPSRGCSYSAVEGQAAVIDDWNGAVLDTKRSRLICWGGGHAGYYGNELYAFDVPSLKWLRLTNPTDPPTAGSDTNWDGTPQSRHSYNGVTYIAHVDRFFAFAGSGCTIGNSGFPPTTNVWTFDFGTLPYGAANWKNMNATGTRPKAGEGSNAAYDPVTKKVWWGEGWNSNPADRWGLFTYDYDANTWTQITNESVFNSSTTTIDTKRGLLVNIGNNRMSVYDIRSAAPKRVDWTTTGGAAIIGASAPGVDYDPVSDRYVCWANGPVYVLNPDTKIWTVNNPAGAPPVGVNGTYHRWSYVPSVNAFVLVTHVDRNVFFYKLTAGSGPGTGGPPPTDTQAPTVPAGLQATAVSATQVDLTWTASTDNVGVTGYRVYRNGTQIATSGTTGFSNTGLTAGTAYSYTVAAVDAAGNVSAQSTSASATTLAGGGGGAPSVSSLTLINADANVAIGGFEAMANGAVLNLGTLPTRNLNIEARTTPSPIGSVVFGYDGNAAYRTEGALPYALAGDTNGLFNPWTPTVGSHSVSATPFTQAGGAGTAGAAETVTFTVIDDPTTPSTNGGGGGAGGGGGGGTPSGSSAGGGKSHRRCGLSSAGQDGPTGLAWAATALVWVLVRRRS